MGTSKDSNLLLNSRISTWTIMTHVIERTVMASRQYDDVINFHSLLIDYLKICKVYVM